MASPLSLSSWTLAGLVKEKESGCWGMDTQGVARVYIEATGIDESGKNLTAALPICPRLAGCLNSLSKHGAFDHMVQAEDPNFPPILSLYFAFFYYFVKKNQHK
jgi:hypothetical protein